MRLTPFVCALALVSWGTTATAIPAADKCEAAKNKVAGKYAFCRQRAEAKAVKTGGIPDFSKCDEKYQFKWQSAETKGGGMCPSNGDELAIQMFITQHTDAVAVALAGGPLPDCSGDLVTCNENLDSCNSSNAECNDHFTVCSSDREALQDLLITCDDSLMSCTGDLSTCTSSLASCETDLLTVNAGTAVQADVLSGKTFSSSAGLGVTGTMTNVAQQNVTPGTAPVMITQGYHDGTGTVAGDADLVAGNVKNSVNIFGVTGTLLNATLKTGQTTTYGIGSDGDLQTGTGRSYTDNGDGTVTDNTTGLMWEKKSDDGSIHDKDNTYTWGMFFSPYSMNGTMVTTFLTTLNTPTCFAGYCDWRIPNVSELQSIVDYENSLPSVNLAFNTACVASCAVTSCSCTRSNIYWSSSTRQQTAAYVVSFDFGDVGGGGAKSNGNYVRAVRGGL